MNLKKYAFIAALAVVFASAVFCQNLSSDFSSGESLFRQNKPQEAIPVLEAALKDPAVDPAAYIYLGIAYYQTGNFKKSLDVCIDGMEKAGTNKRVLAFNAGNSAFALGDYAKAEECYSLASAADAADPAPVLNRSNAILKQGRLQDAISSYEQFLAMAPADEQSSKVTELVSALKDELARREQEQVRQAEEAARIKAEQERIAAEKAEAERVAAEKAAAEKAEQERVAAEKKAEADRIAAAQKAEADRKAAEEAAAAAERRKKLLEDVAASLQNTDTENMSAGAEDVMEYQNESELE